MSKTNELICRRHDELMSVQRSNKGKSGLIFFVMIIFFESEKEKKCENSEFVDFRIGGWIR